MNFTLKIPTILPLKQKKKKELRGVQVCLATGSIASVVNAAACKTNYITLLVSENTITL